VFAWGAVFFHVLKGGRAKKPPRALFKALDRNAWAMMYFGGRKAARAPKSMSRALRRKASMFALVLAAGVDRSPGYRRVDRKISRSASRVIIAGGRNREFSPGVAGQIALQPQDR